MLSWFRLGRWAIKNFGISESLLLFCSNKTFLSGFHFIQIMQK